ncbi:MAG: ABC transporter ATP-binding protein [Phycisphaerales bacterium]|nr:ABC transporter ATP-binding protein [Phycisphaerales bacterium]
MALVATNLAFAYHRASPVLRGVSAAFEAGTVTAVVGPNGSGKTTLLRLLLGLIQPGEGQIRLGDRAVDTIPEPDRARRLAYIPQRSSAAFGFSVRDVVAMGCDPGIGARRALERAGSKLALLGLEGRAAEPFVELSAGQQQRVVLARALAQVEGAPEPAVLLADEPTSAMDPRHAIAAMQIICAQARAGLAVAVVLHDLTAAARFCDRALLLDATGSVAGAGPCAECLDPAALRAVFGVEFLRLGTEAEVAIVPAATPGRR